MKTAFVIALSLMACLVSAQTRIVQTDAVGNKQYDKAQFSVEGNKIIQIDAVGNHLYNKPQYVISGSKIQKADPVGNIKYNTTTITKTK